MRLTTCCQMVVRPIWTWGQYLGVPRRVASSLFVLNLGLLQFYHRIPRNPYRTYRHN